MGAAERVCAWRAERQTGPRRDKWMAHSGARWRDLPEQFGDYAWPRSREKPIWSG